MNAPGKVGIALNGRQPLRGQLMSGMSDYRLYVLAGDGHFETVNEIEARSDDEAIILARSMRLAVKCELWQRDRLVSVLLPRPEQAE